MKVQIHHGPLDAAQLMREIALNGFVAFASTRTNQREIARQIRELLHASGRQVREGEAISPNFPMCMVDTDWHDYDSIVEAVIEEDRAREHGPLVP